MIAELVQSWLPVVSLLVAVAALSWSVLSWRRAGSRLRVHALLYRKVLVLWVFNAGRTSVQVERVVLGGGRGGVGGLELTKQLNIPIRLDPGMSSRSQLPCKDLGLSPEGYTSALAGWESVWLLLGSMQQRRVELLPIPGDYPSEVGWRLAPWGADLTRYIPLATCVPLFFLVYSARTGGLNERGLNERLPLVILLAVALLGHLARAIGEESRRRQIERWLVVAGAVIASLVYLMPRAGTPLVQLSLLALYTLCAASLAWPGGIEVGPLAPFKTHWLRGRSRRS